MSITSPTTRRRFALPLIVLVVGAGVAVWGWRREADRVNAIESYMPEFCTAVAAGPGTAAWAQHVAPAAADYLWPSLRDACKDISAEPDAYRFEVTAGDWFDHMQPSASHAVIILVRGQRRLGLRVQFEESTGQLHVLGTFDPAAIDSR